MNGLEKEEIMRENINEMEQHFIKQQRALIDKIDLKNHVEIDCIKYIAGVDLAYWQEDDLEYAVCCIVVLDFVSKEVIEKKCYKDKISVPYIPGCLAFREIPLVMRTVELLDNKPDIYVFDGNGYLHPRHMGLATHAGVLLNKPSIGIAKSYYKIENVEYDEPENEVMAYNDILIHGEVYGRVIRTKKNVRPVFLSIGNKIDMNTAMNVLDKMITKESHIPMPTRLADIMTHEKRKEYRDRSEGIRGYEK